MARKIGAKMAPRFSTLLHEGGCAAGRAAAPPRLLRRRLFETSPLPTRPVGLRGLLRALDGLLDAVLVDVDEVVVVPLLLGASLALLLGCH